MKYIITEQQSERLKNSIIEFLNNNLTPHSGWDSPKEYKNELKQGDNELFLFLVDSEGSGEDSHMWYSTHKNPHVTIPKKDSPVVLLPDHIYGALDGFFGDIWKPIFKEWFQFHTKLPVTKVDEFGWGR